MLTPWKESYDQPRQCIKKQRHYFANKGPSSQAYGFSRSHVWVWELDIKESWVPENWCFWTVVLENTLKSPLAARRSNQSILKDISPLCSLEGLMLKLKLQYFGHLMPRGDSLKRPWCWKILRQEEKGMTEDEMVGWMASPTQWTCVWVDSGSWWWTRRPGLLRFIKSQTQLSNWTELKEWRGHYSFNIYLHIARIW